SPSPIRRLKTIDESGAAHPSRMPVWRGSGRAMPDQSGTDARATEPTWSGPEMPGERRTQRAESVGRIEPAERVEPREPAGSGEPVERVEPGEPPGSDEPVERVESGGPAGSDEPIERVEPAG